DKTAAARRIGSGDAVGVVVRLAELAAATGWALVLGEAAGFWHAQRGSALVTGWMKGPAAARARQAHGAGLVRGGVAAVAGDADPAKAEVAQVVDWGRDPYALGSWSYPRPGALDASGRWAGAVSRTLVFAGEATCGARHAA